MNTFKVNGHFVPQDNENWELGLLLFFGPSFSSWFHLLFFFFLSKLCCIIDEQFLQVIFFPEAWKTATTKIFFWNVFWHESEAVSMRCQSNLVLAFIFAENRGCRKGFKPCSNRRCVPSHKVCDGANDCGDNSDEFDCKGKWHFISKVILEYFCANTHYANRSSWKVMCSLIIWWD